MSNHRRSPPSAAVTLFVFVLLAAVGGCASHETSGRTSDGVAISEVYVPGVVLDGDLSDWPPDAAAMASEDDLYLRLHMPPEETVTLQNNPEICTLLLDLDANAKTGAPFTLDTEGAVNGHLGVELDIRFAQSIGRDGQPRPQGVEVLAHGPSGPTRLSHADVGVMFAPTYSSSQFEVRISRHFSPALAAALPPSATATERVRTAFALLDRSGAIVGSSEPIEVRMPALATDLPLYEVDLPTCEPHAIRVVSLNCQLAATMTNPDPFGRLLRALNPDIVLVQEWEKATAAQITGWFNQNVPITGSSWSAMTSDGWGVAVVARVPDGQTFSRFGPDHLDRTPQSPADPKRTGDRAIRFAGAVAPTRIGDVAAASIHLKCCGSDSSPEDIARMVEATVINQAVQDAVMMPGGAAQALPMRIIAGDFNLVGSRPPIDLLRRALDADGSDLEIADACTLGDPTTMMTWSDAKTEFTPGRLDYFLYSGGSGLEAVRAFILNTSILTDGSLTRAGLERDDSRASDHMPLVVDLRRRTPP